MGTICSPVLSTAKSCDRFPRCLIVVVVVVLLLLVIVVVVVFCFILSTKRTSKATEYLC